MGEEPLQSRISSQKNHTRDRALTALGLVARRLTTLLFLTLASFLSSSFLLRPSPSLPSKKHRALPVERWLNTHCASFGSCVCLTVPPAQIPQPLHRPCRALQVAIPISWLGSAQMSGVARDLMSRWWKPRGANGVAEARRWTSTCLLFGLERHDVLGKARKKVG